MNVVSQREMFRVSNGCVQEFAPARVPRLTPAGRRVIAALLVRESGIVTPLPSLLHLQYNGGYLTRTIKRLVREGCLKVRAGAPATISVTRLGRIARELRK